MKIRYSHLLYSCVSFLFLTSCKSLQNLGAQDNAPNRTTAVRNNAKEVTFLNDISVTPGSVVSSKHTTTSTEIQKQSKTTSSVTAANTNTTTTVQTTANTEDLNHLQLKYSVILDAAAESLTNLDLLMSIDHWWGTRYCFGGSSEKCIDCSGFTTAVMREVYGITLPRTAQEQYNNSQRISKENLQEGDLVFFHTTRRGISHVGLYLTNNKFIHASTKNGVVVSDLDDKYYSKCFRGGGRMQADLVTKKKN